MEQLNQVKLIGIVGHSRVSEIADRALVHFTIATNTAYMDLHGDMIMETTWHECVYWATKDGTGPKGIERGTPVSLTGRLRRQRYTGADGIERLTTEIIVSDIEILDEQPTTEMTSR